MVVRRKKCSTTEDVLYHMGLVSITIMCLVVLIAKKNASILQNFSLPCVFQMITGFYCPGCGGTRAVKFFLSGHILKSFIYHPLIPYLGIGGGIFMISQTITRVTRGKIKGMKFQNWYVYVMGIIILVQVLIKNILLYFYDYCII